MRTLTLALLVLLASYNSVAQSTCSIKGEVINRDSKAVLVRKCSESFRLFMNNPVKVAIKDGRFDYTFKFEEPEAYEFIFEDELEKGSWMPIAFFPAAGTVYVKLYPQQGYQKNTITGGELNAEYQAYQQMNKEVFEKRRNALMAIQSELSKADELNSPAYKDLIKQLKAAAGDHDAKVPIFQEMEEMQKTHARYTEKAKRLFIDPYDSLLNAELAWKYDYIKEHLSPASYYLIWKDVEMDMKKNHRIAQLVTSVFPLYREKYPDHVYSRLIETQVAGLQTINVGSRYIDFKAPSIAGDTVQLSNAIRDHVALLDFWGSWCGPCIAKSRLVVPVFERYRDKGFKVVGIAREFKSTDAVKKRLAKERFSWLNLVELDDKQNIWNKYGISNGTGLMVLIDRDGTILSIDPTPEELEKILGEKL